MTCLIDEPLIACLENPRSPPPPVHSNSKTYVWILIVGMQDIIQRWLNAELQLKRAADYFSESCALLHDLPAEAVGFSFKQTSIETVSSALQMALESFQLTRSNLAESQIVLNSTLNKSRAIVPITALPPETISYIFTLVIAPHCRKNPNTVVDPLFALPSVCTRWREIALRTPTLWSHIDLFTGYPSSNGSSSRYREELPSRIQLFANRARAIPLHLHFGYRTEAILDASPHLVDSLIQYTPRIASLTFSRISNTVAIEEVINVLANGGSLRVIDIEGHTYQGDTPNPQSLHISWHLIALHGLVELRLVEMRGSDSPFLSQMIEVLLSTPALQVLQLRTMSVHRDLDLGAHLIVSLPHLRHLEVAFLFESGVSDMLSIIHTTSTQLHLVICAQSELDCIAITSFIQRSYVTSLCFWGMMYPPCVEPVLLSARYLHTLLLEMAWGSDSNHTGEYLADVVGIIQQGRNPCLGRLRTLCIMSGYFRSDAMQVLNEIVSPSFRRLILAGCKFQVGDDWVYVESLAYFLTIGWPSWAKFVPKMTLVPYRPCLQDENWDFFVQREVLGWHDL